MGDHPRLEHPLELAVAFGGGEENIVLVAAWDVHCHLPVCGTLRGLINGCILRVDITLWEGRERRGGKVPRGGEGRGQGKGEEGR